MHRPRLTSRSASLLALVASLLVGAPSAVHAVEKTALAPLAQLKQTNERLDKLLKENRNDPMAKRREEMKSIVNNFLDYDELARRSLAQHWDELKPAQRDTFVKTLRELIEKNYIKQLRTNLDYDVLYKGEQLTGEDATVSTVVKVRTKGKSTDTLIDYRMRKKDDRWWVYDIVTDDVSMVKNYKSQFHKIITQQSFDALLKKMRTKIEEVDKTEATKGASAEKDAGPVKGASR